MRSLITTAAITTLSAITAGPALAQPFIEIEWEGTATNFSNEMENRFGGRVVFDAAASPIRTESFYTHFGAIEGGMYDTPTSADPSVESPFEPASGGLYFFNNGNLEIYSGSVSLVINPTTSDFSIGIDSLPDDPASYAFTGGSDDLVYITGTLNTVFWTPGSGFAGGSFRYWIREVENPNPPEPCIADADGNGILDLSDVNIFAATFVAGCP